LVLISSSSKTRTAFRPSSVSGTFTTMFGCIAASSRPSRRMPAVSVAITSALIGPSTTSTMSLTTAS
jgi:hypothetical protein